jgi:hypothetical protein
MSDIVYPSTFVRHADVSHFRAPYKNAMLSGLGAPHTNDIVIDSGLAVISPDEVGAYLDSLSTMTVGQESATTGFQPLATAELVPGSAQGAGMSASAWMRQQRAAGMTILAPREFDWAIPGQQLIATSDPGAMAQYATVSTGTGTTSGDYAILSRPGSDALPVFVPVVAPQYQAAGMSTGTKVLLVVGAAAAVYWLVKRNQKPSYSRNKPKNKRSYQRGGGQTYVTEKQFFNQVDHLESLGMTEAEAFDEVKRQDPDAYRAYV